MSIPFTQYMMPDGRKTYHEVKRPPEIEEMAHRVIADGLRFESEVLSTGEVSITVFDPRIEEDVAIEICPNGPEIRAATDKLVKDAFGRLAQIAEYSEEKNARESP